MPSTAAVGAGRQRARTSARVGDPAGQRAPGSVGPSARRTRSSSSSAARRRARARPPPRPGRSRRRLPRPARRAPPPTEPHWWIHTPPRAPPRRAPERDDDVGLGRRLEVGACGRTAAAGSPPSACAVRLARRRELRGAASRRHDPDRAEPARLRHRGGQLVARQPAAHPGLHDGQLDPSAARGSPLTRRRRPRAARGGARPPRTGAACARTAITNAITSTSDCSTIMIAPPTFWSSIGVRPQIRGTVS